MKAMILGFLAAGLVAVTNQANASTITYGLAVTDFLEPSSFSFQFSAPIVPLTGLNSYSFDGSISLTDATGDGVSASPLGLLEFWRLEAGDGLGAWGIIDDVGGTSTLNGSGPFSFAASGLFDCSAILGSCQQLRLTFGFGMSGYGDQLASAGTFALSPLAVPLPATAWLMLSGLGGLGLLGRRRNA